MSNERNAIIKPFTDISKQKWIVINSHRGVPMVCGEGQNDGGHICRVDARVDKDLNDRRARVIAAAPELLAACKLVAEGCNTAVDNEADWTLPQIREHLWGLQKIVCAAIAKAEST